MDVASGFAFGYDPTGRSVFFKSKEYLKYSIFNRKYSIGISFGDGGERGIRTLGAAINSTHDFQSCSFSQLGHLSVLWIATHNHSIKDGGEDRIRTCGGRKPPTVFETAAFNHSATSPG